MFTAVYVSASPLTLLLCEHARTPTEKTSRSRSFKHELRGSRLQAGQASPASYRRTRTEQQFAVGLLVAGLQGKESKCTKSHHRHPHLTHERRTGSAPASAIASRPRKRPWNAQNIRPWIRDFHRRRMQEAMWTNSRSTTIATAKRHTKRVAVRSRRKRQRLGS